MIILAIADRAPTVSILETLKKYPNIDLICTLGDLDYFSLQELEHIDSIPKIGVYGNHCSGNYFDSLGIINLHLQTFEHGGLLFGGFEGSIRYKESIHAKMYTQAEAEELLIDFPRVDVMLAHSPPYGINDEVDSASHQGLFALRSYIEHKKPKYFLHGHTYPSQEDMVTMFGETDIVYVFGDRVIEI
jgi:uncharacterized protein